MQGKIAADFRVQTYQGKPVLTWWEGQLFVGDGDGVGQVYDTSYKPIAQVARRQRLHVRPARVHDHAANTALVLAYERYNRSLTAWGGPKDAKIVDNIVQEIDLATGLVLFEWHSFGNVSPDESDIPVPKQKGSEWEYFHANAVDIDTDGNFLVSARNTLDDLQDQPRHGQDHVAPGRQEVRLQARPGRAVRLAAQHPRAARRHVQALRQRGRAAGPQELARADAQARRAGQDGDARERLHAPARSCSPPARATSSACPTATRSSAGAHSAGSPSSARPARCSSTATSPRATTTTARSATSGPARPAQPPKVVASRGRRQHHRPRELERRDRASRAGSCWPARTRASLAPVGTKPPRRASRPRSRRSRRAALVAHARLRRGGQRARHERAGQADSVVAGLQAAPRLLGRELAAGGVDVAAAGEADGRAQAVLLQRGLEGVDRVARASRRRPSRSGCTGSG